MPFHIQMKGDQFIQNHGMSISKGGALTIIGDQIKPENIEDDTVFETNGSIQIEDALFD